MFTEERQLSELYGHNKYKSEKIVNCDAGASVS